jgi:aspartate/methionine/tyrosine aminotransferase
MKLNDFKLERFFAKYEFTTPYLLCSSDCESFKVEELFELDKNAEKDFKKLWLGYTEYPGSLALRVEISKLYIHSTPENIIVFAGAEEGIFVFMNALLNPGDNIIVQAPCYQSLYEVANAIGCNVYEWVMNAENNWELDIDFLRKNITEHTKAIIINFPNNPTGYTISKEKLNKIIDIAKQHDIFILSDEVYRFLEYREEDRLPAVCDVYDKGVSLGVMSKSFGLPGLRIGWIVTKDNALLRKMASFKDFTTICNSAPSEFLAALALKHKEFILNRNLEIVKTNLQHLEAFFEKHSNRFAWIKPKAGPLIFPELKFTQNAEIFCLDLIKKKGVLVMPGNQFNYSNNHVRIGFGRKNMLEALAKLEEYFTSSG